MALDLYEGRDPREIPAYTVRETAYYLRANEGTLRHWLSGRSYRTMAGAKKRSEPVIKLARRKPALLSFYNLIEVHVLRALRTEEEIPLQRIRKALDYLETELGTPRPLLNADFETNGLDLFVDKYGELVNVSQGGKIVVRRNVAETLRRIEHDAEGVAQKFFLWALNPLEERKVSVDPRVAFGRAVLTGTGVPISILSGRSHAGEDAAVIAEDYRLLLSDVEWALQWEPRVKAA